MRPLVVTLVLAAVASTGTRAQADSPSDTAAQLFTSGKAAMDRGDLVTACQELAESQRLDPAPGTLLNLGECEARSGKVATALGHVEKARAALPAGDFRIPFADGRIESLRARVPKLVVRVTGKAPADMRVLCDGEVVIVGLPLILDPGAHVVTLTAPGRPDARTEVRLDEGRSETVVLAPGPAAGDAPSGSWSSRRILGAVALGAGVTSLAAGTVVGFIAKVTYDSASSTSNCPHGASTCDARGVQQGQTADAEAAISTGLFVAGSILAAGGALLYFTAPKDVRVSVSPAIGATSAGLSVVGIF
jgi:hypothetical protein